MMIRMLIATMLCVIIAFQNNTLAGTYDGQDSSKFFQFRLSELIIFQPGVNGYSAYLGWSPTLYLSSFWGVRANVGVTYLRNVDAAFFPVYDYQGFLLYRLTSIWSLEAGLGQQIWLSQAERSSAMIYTVGTSFYISSLIFGFIDRLFVDYSYFNLSAAHTNELNIGIGFSF